MEPLTVSCYGVIVRIADTADIGVDRLRAALPPEFTEEAASSPAAVAYAIDTAPPEGSSRDERFRLSRDGEEILVSDSDDDLVHRLRQDIDISVARRSRGRLFVHAAVVGWRGWAIVIPGRSHTGKSTLVAELVRRGARYYSDEYAVLDEEGRVHPYSRTPVLRDERHTLDDLRLVREDEPLEPLPIALVVTGAYRADATWRPAVIRGTRAVLPLIDGTVLARDESARMLRIVSRVAQQAVALSGPRGEATEVAAHLLDLIDDATVSRSLGGDGDFADSLARIADQKLRARTDRRVPPARRLLAARYVRIPDFLSPEEHHRLLAHALAHEAEFKASGVVGHKGEGTLNYSIRKSMTLLPARLEELWDIFAPRLQGVVAGVRKELGLPWFRLGRVERQLTAHGRGGFFVPHTDVGHPVAASRRISAVYYFHAMPKQFTGGELRLYDTWTTPGGTTGAGTYTTLAPVDNSLVFFPSNAFHEVRTVESETDTFGGSRFTVTIWFHEEPAPAAESPASTARAEAR